MKLFRHKLTTCQPQVWSTIALRWDSYRDTNCLAENATVEANRGDGKERLPMRYLFLFLGLDDDSLVLLSNMMNNSYVASSFAML